VGTRSRWKLAVALVVVGVAGGTAMGPLRGQDDAANQNRPIITARGATIDGQQVGELVVDGQVAIRIREAAGGYSPEARAQIAARRLDAAIGQGATYEDVVTGKRDGEWAVLARDDLIVTADSAHARMNNTTPEHLAQLWRSNLVNALVGRPVAAPPDEPRPAGVDWSESGKKIVPILDVGNRGVRIGAAQVVGPRQQVDQVKAVGQIELEVMNKVRAKVYVPISSYDVTRLDRVQGVSVWLVGSLRILEL
jgi:hypothetical protein